MHYTVLYTVQTSSDETGHVAGGGLPVVRVAQTIIRAPVQDVANLWWSVNSRKEWDSVNTEDSKLVRTVSPTQRLVYLNGKPKRGGVISSRDFAYAMNRVPPQEVHAHVGSQLFVQVNAPDEEPLHKSSVRGDVNSMLLFEPIDAHTTKVCTCSIYKRMHTSSCCKHCACVFMLSSSLRYSC
jgi:START domain